MTDLRDFSRLPADPAYWERLEDRILSALPDPAEQAAGWWAPLARRAGALAGLALAAGLATWLLLPQRGPEAVTAPGGLFRAPADDPALVAFVSAPDPPRLASLMVAPAGGAGHD